MYKNNTKHRNGRNNENNKIRLFDYNVFLKYF